MKFWQSICMVTCLALLSACATDLVSPPYEDHPNIKIAEMARARGDVAQAIHDYRDVLKECPNCQNAYIGLGMSLIDANSPVEAKHTFEKGLALFPNNDAMWTGLGLVYLIIDQPENAIRSFERALKINPRNDKAFNGYGVALDMMNDYMGAQAHYRAAMELAPSNVAYESNLALSIALSGNAPEAIRILERLSCSPNSTPRIRQNLSLAYGLAGDIKMAKKIGRMDLSDEMVMSNVAYLELIQRTEQYSGMIPKDHTVPLDSARRWQERH